ncbi:MAG: LuxR C-terminal-related transcriptional regulator [Motilibacteraceae bacterium]
MTSSPLAPWGVDQRAELLYRASLRRPGGTLGELARALGWDVVDARAALEPLMATGLARADASASTDARAAAAVVVVPASPSTALQAMLTREEERLAVRARQVDEARQALERLSEDHRVGQVRRWDTAPTQLVVADEVRPALVDLARATTGPFRSAHVLLGPFAEAEDELTRLVARQVRDGRRADAVYPVSVLDHPEQLAHVRFWSTQGERARFARRVPVQFLLFGDEAAVLPAAPGRADGDGDERDRQHLVVRDRALVGAVRALFDLLWERSAGLPRGAGGDDDTPEGRQAVLELLALGAKDEAIARQLGISLRTVRRRVAYLMDELGASTRFQAGMEAAKRRLV